MRPLIFALCVVFASSSLFAQKPGWQPPPGHTQVPIWPGTAPDAQFGPPTNTETTEPGEVDNVSRPTMTVYSAQGKNTGAAVVVFPGGGYYVLAIDLEGTEVCDWLTSKGITCVLLKYRVPHSGPQWDERCKCEMNPKAPMALEDAQRTVGLVRFHAAEYHIDPHKIGVLGFSAGGHLSAAISTHFGKRLYAAVDAADKESCRPDFAVALYPGHLWISNKKFELNPDVPVTRQTPANDRHDSGVTSAADWEHPISHRFTRRYQGEKTNEPKEGSRKCVPVGEAWGVCSRFVGITGS
jgi:acetyl esterase/lipase